MDTKLFEAVLTAAVTCTIAIVKAVSDTKE